MTASRVGLIAAATGTLLVAASSLVGSGFALLALPFAAWAAAPYLLLWLLSRTVASPWAVGGAGLAGLAVEVGIRAAVFVYPRGSTSAIALVFSPAYVAIVAMPAGAALGWLFGFAWTRTGRVARGLMTSALAAILALTVLGFARPELFPTAVIERRAALEAIGEPRVVSGGDRFESVVLSDQRGWFQAGQLDDQPGDEIAAVDHDGAELIDATDHGIRTRVPFGGERGRLWNSFSQLVRMNGTWVVVQTGGGYQDTEVRSLENVRLWDYRPDPDLPPSALRPADLDGDGATEFYASTVHHVARLDQTGAERWRQQSAMAHLMALAPATPATAAWVVGGEYGRVIRIWNHDGTVLGELTWPDGRVLGIADWPVDRVLLVAGEALQGLGLDGRVRFTLPLPPRMTAVEAVAARLDVNAPAVLAVVSAADRDVGRSRLQVFAADGQVLYDEVRARLPRLLAARRAAGSDVLLVADQDLRVLGRRAQSSSR